MKPYHIVFTTIYHPYVLENLFENIATHNHLNSVKVWIVGDKKTPASCGAFASEISKRGLETVYLDIDAQDEWGKQCPRFYQRIPYNNETRRNIGYLRALQDGCEVMIAIDDDNYPTDDDFISAHSRTGSEWEKGVLQEPTGFYNLCEHIESEPARMIYPRGFPFKLRGQVNRPILKDKNNTIIGVTAGLWLQDPDVDATTWLNGKITGIRYQGDQTNVLDQNTWTPVNTQNTSVVRELIPAFLCIPMGWEVPGGRIQRYGDIWGGYILQTLMKETDYHVAFGHPIVDHRRNPHDYVDDLRFEFWGMILTDWLVDQLRLKFTPSSNIIIDRVSELALCLEESVIPELPEWCPSQVNEFMRWTAGNLRHWAEACRKFN